MSGFVICGKPQFSGEWVRLGDICNVRSGGTPKRSVSEYWDQGTIPWVKIGDISGKYIFTTEECISEVGLNSSAAKLFQPGTLLFSIFASIGAVGILTVPAATNQAIAGLEITSKMINRDYLFYFLKSSEMGAKQSGRGVAQNNINLGSVRPGLTFRPVIFLRLHNGRPLSNLNPARGDAPETGRVARLALPFHADLPANSPSPRRAPAS